ncbi:hypothetical protein AKJ66_01910 [candidate division MSBL1 archaeon SCGC-AAA259E22]|uniref:Uncharacterized protein n=1 Tax=candidate division MSBL1 archaeon SCGC-AAA259E22 TaxID=1698265 RepID=A0A133UGY6_9EURY|nr:hypothetical protein AKJ66_01910 [candidate division MSBL1 archaeon SCGC-AAA259E22]
MGWRILRIAKFNSQTSGIRTFTSSQISRMITKEKIEDCRNGSIPNQRLNRSKGPSFEPTSLIISGLLDSEKNN